MQTKMTACAHNTHTHQTLVRRTRSSKCQYVFMFLAMDGSFFTQIRYNSFWLRYLFFLFYCIMFAYEKWGYSFEHILLECCLAHCDFHMRSCFCSVCLAMGASKKLFTFVRLCCGCWCAVCCVLLMLYSFRPMISFWLIWINR